MKKKNLIALAIAAVMVCVPALSFGALSPNYGNSGSGGGGGSSYDSGSSNDSGSSSGYVPNEVGASGSVVTAPSSPSVQVAVNGEKISVGLSSKDTTGTTMSMVVGTTTSTGESVTMNSKGETVVGNTAVGVATGKAETAGLPADVVSTINELNSTKTLAETFPGQNLEGYAKLGNTRAMITTEQTTGAKDHLATEVSMIIDTLPANVQSVVVMCYNNGTGRWSVINATVDPVTKKISFVLPGSCTIQIAVK